MADQGAYIRSLIQPFSGPPRTYMSGAVQNVLQAGRQKETRRRNREEEALLLRQQEEAERAKGEYETLAKRREANNERLKRVIALQNAAKARQSKDPDLIRGANAALQEFGFEAPAKEAPTHYDIFDPEAPEMPAGAPGAAPGAEPGAPAAPLAPPAVESPINQMLRADIARREEERVASPEAARSAAGVPTGTPEWLAGYQALKGVAEPGLPEAEQVGPPEEIAKRLGKEGLKEAAPPQGQVAQDLKEYATEEAKLFREELAADPEGATMAPAEGAVQPMEAPADAAVQPTEGAAKPQAPPFGVPPGMPGSLPYAFKPGMEQDKEIWTRDGKEYILGGGGDETTRARQATHALSGLLPLAKDEEEKEIAIAANRIAEDLTAHRPVPEAVNKAMEFYKFRMQQLAMQRLAEQRNKRYAGGGGAKGPSLVEQGRLANLLGKDNATMWKYVNFAKGTESWAKFNAKHQVIAEGLAKFQSKNASAGRMGYGQLIKTVFGSRFSNADLEFATGAVELNQKFAQFAKELDPFRTSGVPLPPRLIVEGRMLLEDVQKRMAGRRAQIAKGLHASISESGQFVDPMRRPTAAAEGYNLMMGSYGTRMKVPSVPDMTRAPGEAPAEGAEEKSLDDLIDEDQAGAP